jgi:hypothetical protein
MSDSGVDMRPDAALLYRGVAAGTGKAFPVPERFEIAKWPSKIVEIFYSNNNTLHVNHQPQSTLD